MHTINQKAFELAAKTLNKKSKFYAEDLAALRAHYCKKDARSCREAVGRLSVEVSQAEINRNCQL